MSGREFGLGKGEGRVASAYDTSAFALMKGTSQHGGARLGMH